MNAHVLLALLVCVPIPNEVPEKGVAKKKEVEKLQGAWVLESAILYDKAYYRPTVMKFQSDKVTTKYKNEESWGTFTVDPTKKLKEIDVRWGGKHLCRGIYELDGDTLKICIAALEDRPRPTEFAGIIDVDQIFRTFKRQKP